MADKKFVLEINGEKVTFDAIKITDSLPKLRCGDDRTPADIVQKYQLGMLGAGVGLRGVVFATLNKLNIQFATQRILPLIEEIAGPVTSHTDNHHYGEPRSCGHVGLTQKDPASYNVTPAQVEDLLTLWHNSDQVSLPGDHAAKAVLLIHGDYTVMHQGQDETGGEVKVFVVNGSAIGNLLKNLASRLSDEVGVDADTLTTAMTQMAALHAQNTVMGLGPDLPIYIVDFSKGEMPAITLAPAMRELGRLSATTMFPNVSK